MNEIQQKIVKTSKVVAIILKIGFILIAAAIGLLIIGMGVLAFADRGVATSLQDALTITTQGTSAVGIAVSNIILVFGLFIIQLVAVFMVFLTLHRIFSAICKDHTPFTNINAKRMRKVAVLIIAMGAISSITEFIAHKLITTQDGYSIDGTWLVMAAVIYCIALIFDYGCQLQQQSDETL